VGGASWEGPINAIATSLTGPVALGVSVVALAVTGMVLVFGGELTDFAKRALYVTMAIAFLVGGTSFLNTMFNSPGPLSDPLRLFLRPWSSVGE